MKRSFELASKTLATICLLVLPAHMLSAEDGYPIPVYKTTFMKPADVALGPGGSLSGILSNASGKSTSPEIIYLIRSDEVVANTFADADGKFEFQEIPGGVYTLQCGSCFGIYRFWSAEAAPPAAVSTADLNLDHSIHWAANGAALSKQPDGAVIRGAGPGFFGGLHWPSIHPGQWVKHPWVVGAAIGTAVALPIALHNDEPSS